jgi:hypothetical protein
MATTSTESKTPSSSALDQLPLSAATLSGELPNKAL